MPLPSKRLSGFSRWLSAEDRRAFKVQLVVVILVITLLELGFYELRALRAIAERSHLHRVITGWDGLAWYVWILAAPATLALIRRFPFERDRVAWSIARLSLGSACIYFVITNGRYLFRLLPNLWLPDATDLPTDFLTYLHTQLVLLPLDFLTFCGFFASSFAVHAYVNFQQNARQVAQLTLQAASLRSELAEAKFAALQAQLHPHFLFNAFNAIAGLVRQKETDAAVQAISELSSLLRFAMSTADRTEQTLAQELEFAHAYLRMEQIRFGPKLIVEIDVASDAAPLLVPTLLLQPLVENAVKHGIARRIAPGRVRITARRHADLLHLEIYNDGPSQPRSAPAGESGIGLTNTRRRLKCVYDTGFELRIHQENAATLVALRLPIRNAENRPGQLLSLAS